MKSLLALAAASLLAACEPPATPSADESEPAATPMPATPGPMTRVATPRPAAAATPAAKNWMWEKKGALDQPDRRR